MWTNSTWMRFEGLAQQEPFEGAMKGSASVGEPLEALRRQQGAGL